MIIFSKYSNERDPRFRIRTDIVQENGRRVVRKTAAAPEAKGHLRCICESFRLLSSDLDGSGLQVNPCKEAKEGLEFPYREGQTLEERLDALLAANRLDELEDEIAQYFSMMERGRTGCSLPFSETGEFLEVFGHAGFSEPQYCRALSDIDMIFSNAVETEDGYELIDYEWTFVFPIPVKYIQYRCLYYYLYGNAGRSALIKRGLFERFGICPQEQKQFERMERRFQQYILGSYTPVRMLYDRISDGVIDIPALAGKESERRRKRVIEVYFDDGRGFGVWNMRRFRIGEEGPVSLQLTLPAGTKCVRVDPCSYACLVRLHRIGQDGQPLLWQANGEQMENGDLLFDTGDPQITFCPRSSSPVEVAFLAEPLGGLTRELILNQHGRISWMEQTRAWRAARKIKELLGRS